MRKILLAALTLMLFLGLAACTNEVCKLKPVEGIDAQNPEIQAILQRGVLRVGVKDDAPGLGSYNPETSQFEGLEIDMAHLLAERILGNRDLVKFTSVTPDTRGRLLDNDQLDLIIATFTIREERKEFWNFSQSYYVDAVGLLAYAKRGFEGLADLDGKTIAVISGSTTRAAIESYIEEAGLCISINFQEFPSSWDCSDALAAAYVDAFSVDKAILAGFLSDERIILPDSFRRQEYGIATRLSSPYLTKIVDNFVSDIKADGTLCRLKAANNLFD